MVHDLGRGRSIVGACLYLVIRRNAAIAGQIRKGYGKSAGSRRISCPAI